jgi:signal-transduction protein with cAMP-binding, CBS, and nucleotidyltransferase domain/DNA polymerase III epsilon subunit-like protein
MPSRQHGAASLAATPLIDMGAVVLDTETTGLDVRKDRIVQIGALKLHGADIVGGKTLDIVVNPGIAIPESSSRIHGLRDANVAGKPGFAAVAPVVSAFAGQAVVVGHSINFDMAVLRHEAARHGISWPQWRVLDIALLAAGLDRGLVDTSLDALALSLGVPVEGRHTALGDARATAEIYCKLIPRLLAAGVRTLGEAELLSRRPANLIAQQEQAGWFARPEDRPDFASAAIRSGGQRAVDSFLYRQRLGDVMRTEIVSIAPDASLHEAAKSMDEHGIGCLFVRTGTGTGIVTERDILRAIAEFDADGPAKRVGEVMSAPVIAAPAETFLYRALGLMARRNLRYLGVTGANGEVAGLFTLRTLLRERALATMSVTDEIAAANRPRELARVQAALPGLASGLLADGLEARAVAAIIAAEGRAMTARAAEIAQGELLADGFGPPPADYALLVLGSGGRGESLLAPDQDNALVIANDYEGDLDSSGDWFTRFAERINEILDRAGIPYCKGGVMAKNRQWRKTLAGWTAEIEGWTQSPSPQTVLNVDIFYDFTAAHYSSAAGARLADLLRRRAMEIASGAQGLLRALGEASGAHRAPLGLLGRIKTDDNGRVDLKSGGLLPITAGARVMALRHGIDALSTPERLSRSTEKAGRGESDARILIDIHGFLLSLVLTQQIADIEAGITPTNRVALKSLTPEDESHLRDALGRVDLIHDMVRDLLEGG